MFDWLVSDVPRSVTVLEPEKRKAMHLDEVRYRARLYRNLGYDKDFAVARCLGNLAWAYDRGGTSPLSKQDVAKAVGEVYR